MKRRQEDPLTEEERKVVKHELLRRQIYHFLRAPIKMGTHPTDAWSLVWGLGLQPLPTTNHPRHRG